MTFCEILPRREYSDEISLERALVLLVDDDNPSRVFASSRLEAELIILLAET